MKRVKSSRSDKKVRNSISKRNVYFALFILVIGLTGYFSYFYFYSVKECGDISCYQNSLNDCKKVWVINEDANYVWRYEILNKKDSKTCNVEVILLKIKEGNIDIEDLEDKSMICNVDKLEDILPEKEMLRCSGELREEFQEIIIDRLHNYLLQNIGEINDNL